MSEIVKLDLSHGSIDTVQVDGEPHVVLRPAVTSIGLDYPSQLRKLRDRSWANRCDIPTVAEDGKVRQMVAVDVRTFLMWLATVNETKVAPEARPTLVAYQTETTAAVSNYWTRGFAERQQDATPETVSWNHAAAYARSHFGLNVSPGEFRDLLVKGDILRLDRTPRRSWEHLFHALTTRWEIKGSILPQLIAHAVRTRQRLIDEERELQMSLPMPFAVLPRRNGAEIGE